LSRKVIPLRPRMSIFSKSSGHRIETRGEHQRIKLVVTARSLHAIGNYLDDRISQNIYQ